MYQETIEEPLSVCSLCRLVGNEQQVRYWWGDDASYDEPYCFDCHCIVQREAPPQIHHTMIYR